MVIKIWTDIVLIIFWKLSQKIYPNMYTYLKTFKAENIFSVQKIFSLKYFNFKFKIVDLL